MVSPIERTAAVGALDSHADLAALATCPSCHTQHTSLSNGAVAAGAGWRCGRCGQQWDARRLSTTEAYAAWVAARSAGV